MDEWMNVLVVSNIWEVIGQRCLSVTRLGRTGEGQCAVEPRSRVRMGSKMASRDFAMTDRGYALGSTDGKRWESRGSAK